MAPIRLVGTNEEAIPRSAGLVLALLLHAVVLAAILTHPAVRSAVAPVTPIMVSFVAREPAIAPPAAAAPAPALPVPTPKVRQPPRRVEPERLVSMAPAPAPAAPSVAEPAPNVPAAARAEPAPAPSVQALARAEPERPSAASASAPAPAPAAVSAPRFDAAYLQNPAPVYPALSRRMKEQGKVMLRVHVSPNGAADQVELRDSSGSVRLDTAALETVKRWRFLPARQGEQSVPAWVLVPISFYLEG